MLGGINFNLGLDLNWGAAINSIPFLLDGMLLTIIISIAGLFFGFIIGALIGIARVSKNKIIFSLGTVYVEAVRGTPILVQAVYLYFGINQLLQQAAGFKIEPITAGIIVITINSGAYIAEIVRGSIQSIHKGQVEAGRSLGLSKFKTFRYIVWPQAFQRMIPPLGNQFIISLKDTSLFSVIAVGELLRQGQISVSATFCAFEIYTFVAILYLAMILPLSGVLKIVERRLNVS